MENSENNESPEILENNMINEDDTHILIDEETILLLNNIFDKSKFNINFTKSLLCKLLMIQEAEDGSDSYSDETFNELYKKINSFSENAEYVLKSYNTFYDKEKKIINIEEVTFLAQIWTGDMYNCDGIEALRELEKELDSDLNSLKQINF